MVVSGERTESFDASLDRFGADFDAAVAVDEGEDEEWHDGLGKRCA